MAPPTYVCSSVRALADGTTEPRVGLPPPRRCVSLRGRYSRARPSPVLPSRLRAGARCRQPLGDQRMRDSLQRGRAPLPPRQRRATRRSSLIAPSTASLPAASSLSSSTTSCPRCPPTGTARAHSFASAHDAHRAFGRACDLRTTASMFVRYGRGMGLLLRCEDIDVLLIFSRMRRGAARCRSSFSVSDRKNTCSARECCVPLPSRLVLTCGGQHIWHATACASLRPDGGEFPPALHGRGEGSRGLQGLHLSPGNAPFTHTLDLCSHQVIFM